MEEVIQWIRSKNPELEEDITRDTDLIETRLIKSLSFMEFIELLEELSGEQIDISALSIDDIRTLDRIDKRFLAPAT